MAYTPDHPLRLGILREGKVPPDERVPLIPAQIQELRRRYPQVDVVVHIILPEMLEKRLPRVANYLRRTSPRWGRSWRDWSR